MTQKEKIEALNGEVASLRKEVARLTHIVESMSEKLNLEDIPPRNLDDVIPELLKMLGVPANLIGYKYIVSSVKICLENEKILSTGGITKALYPTVASQFGTIPSRVERGIRHAIERACVNSQNIDELFKVFGNTINPDRGKPTNGEFLAMVCAEIRRKI